MEKLKTEKTEIDTFLSGPLATWFASCISTFTEEKLTYEELVKGSLIHNVFIQMDLQYRDIEGWDRQTDLEIILSNISHFYEDELGQIILRIPDVRKITDSEFNSEIELLLHLLLGCAVQCPRSDTFITNIMELDETVQSGIVQYITEVLHHPNIVFSKKMLISHENEDSKVQRIFGAVRQLCQERNDYKNKLTNPRMRFDDNDEQLLIEWRCKAKMHHQEVLELKDELLECKSELEESKEALAQLLKKNEQLEAEAKNIRFYKDELDAANEKAEKSDHFEREMNRWKKKFEDVSFQKDRVAKLELANKLLSEEKAKMKEAYCLYKMKTERSEKYAAGLKRQIEELKAQNSEYLKNFREESEEKNRLLIQLKKSANKKALLENKSSRELNVQQHKENNNPSNNITRDIRMQKLTEKLDLDNAKFSTLLVNSLRNKCVNESSAKVLQLQNDNQKLTSTIKSLREHLEKTLDENKKLHKQEFERLQNMLQHKQINETKKDENGIQKEVWTFPYNSRKLIIKKK